VTAVTIARAAIFAALIAVALPLPAAQALSPYPPAGLVTTQLAPKDVDTRRPTVCTEQYAPVCGRLRNVVKTYPNQCYARAAGAEVIAQGPCSGSDSRPLWR
jgi:hypothetical protein